MGVREIAAGGKSGHPPFTGINPDQNWIDDDDDDMYCRGVVYWGLGWLAVLCHCVPKFAVCC